MFVAVDGKVAGLLGVADPIKVTTLFFAFVYNDLGVPMPRVCCIPSSVSF